MTRFLAGEISQRLLGAKRHFPALVLTELRQTGKTTRLRHFFPDPPMNVSLDRPARLRTV
jgi:hypothetical protein